MMRTTPRRRISLHRSHILFTDGRTFMSLLLVAVHDPAACQIVRRELHQDPIPREDSDVVHPHLPGDVRQDLVSVLQGHAEHRVGQRLGDRALDLYGILLRHAPGTPSTGGIASPRARRNGPRARRPNAQYRGWIPWSSRHHGPCPYARAVRTSRPSSVTAIVCSKWADSDPS